VPFDLAVDFATDTRARFAAFEGVIRVTANLLRSPLNHRVVTRSGVMNAEDHFLMESLPGGVRSNAFRSRFGMAGRWGKPRGDCQAL
jgi:hypothetical protein